MSIGLDIGSFRLKSLRRQKDQLIGRSSRSVYSVVPYSEAHLALLDQSNIAHAVSEDIIVLMGDSAVDFAKLFQVRTLPLLPEGAIPENDPLARQVIASLVEALLPKPATSGEVCCMALPGTASGRSSGKNSELEFFSRLARLRGYTPVVLSSGTAAILAESVDRSFTGMSLSMGAAGCQLALAHRGIEIANCVIPRGGDWIDEQLARRHNDSAYDINGEQFLDIAAATRWKETAVTNIASPANDEDQFVSDLYQDLLGQLIEAAELTFLHTAQMRNVPQPITLICTGGGARINGFAELLASKLQTNPLPLEIAELRMAAESDYTAARGLLISAALESETRANFGAVA